MRHLIRYCCFLYTCVIAFAAPPANDGIFPCGGKAGSNVSATLSGKTTPWPPKFWCSNSKVKIVPGEKSPAVTVQIDPAAEPGPCLIRSFNKEGSSEPFLFLIGAPTENEILEDEKRANRSISEAQPVGKVFPCVIYGRLNPTKDVDCYSIPLKKGETLFASLEGYTFRGGIDSLMHLYHPEGHRIMLAMDNAVSPDPEFLHQAERDGIYTLAVMAFATPPSANVHFHGSTKSSYRINLALKQSDIPKRLHTPKAKAVTDISKPLVPPIDIFQTLTPKSPRHELSISVKARETWKIKVNAFTHRFPTDPVFTLKNKDGKLIREVDDTKGKTRDTEYLWKTSTEGNYTLQIYDRFHRSGPEYRYQLVMEKPKPDFNGVVEKSNYVIEAGKETSIKIKHTRLDNHKAPLKLDIANLPESITFEPPKIPEKPGDITIKLLASKQAKSFSGPIQFTLTETEGDAPISKNCPFTFQDKNARGPYLIDRTPDIWLTVKEVKPEKEPKTAKNSP